MKMLDWLTDDLYNDLEETVEAGMDFVEAGSLLESMHSSRFFAPRTNVQHTSDGRTIVITELPTTKSLFDVSFFWSETDDSFFRTRCRNLHFSYASTADELCKRAMELWLEEKEMKKSMSEKELSTINDGWSITDSKLQDDATKWIRSIEFSGYRRNEGQREKYTTEPMTFCSLATIENIFTLGMALEERDIKRKEQEEREMELSDGYDFTDYKLPTEDDDATLHVILRLRAPEKIEKPHNDDFLRLFNEEALSDFSIRVGGREIRAHRTVLAAKSPVFSVMLKHEDTNEAKNVTSELLVAADKYGLNELKTSCETLLIHALAIDNACQLLARADIYGANLLKLHAVQFLLQRREDMTEMPAGWSELAESHPALVADIASNFDKEEEEEDVAGTEGE